MFITGKKAYHLKSLDELNMMRTSVAKFSSGGRGNVEIAYLA